MEGFIFTPKPGYGRIKVKSGKFERLTSLKLPKRVDKVIVPGFVCTHLHTIQTHARNTAENLELLDWLSKVIWPFEASLNAKSAYASAFDGMQECLSNGITSILDMATTRHTDSVFEAARDSGIRAWIGKALMDQGPKNLIDSKPLEEVFAHLNDWNGFDRGRLQVTLCPRFALSCSKELLHQVRELSDQLGLLQHSHASENFHECEWIKKHYGKSNIEFLDSVENLNEKTILAHGVHLSSKDLRILKNRKVSVSHCPTSNLKLASGIADLTRMKNINISLGVDGAACNNLLDPFFEMRLAHLLGRYLHGLKGISAKFVFEIATLGGARALHAEKEIGSIEERKQADFLVLKVPERVRFNPEFPYESLIHSLSANDIRETWVAGKKV